MFPVRVTRKIGYPAWGNRPSRVSSRQGGRSQAAVKIVVIHIYASIGACALPIAEKPSSIACPEGVLHRIAVGSAVGTLALRRQRIFGTGIAVYS